MSIKKMFLIIYSIMVLALIIIAGLVVLIINNQSALEHSQDIRYKSYLAADELRQSSDDLTRLARTYVVTGDANYEQMYNDILDIRNGKKPRPQNYERIYWDFVAAGNLKPKPDGETIALQTIMENLGFTEDEFKLLSQSQANSDGLIKTEVMAMNAIMGKIDADGQKLMKPGETKEEFARRIMHD